MAIKKHKFALKNGNIINGYEVSFKHPNGKTYSWRTTSYKEAVKFDKQMKSRRRK